MKKIISLTTLLLIIVVLVTFILFLLKNDKKEQIYANHEIIVRQIEELGNLEVVKYNIQDMMEYQKVRKWLPNSKASLKIVGEVIACVDLTQIGKDDIYTNKDSVSLILPIPEICSYRIDHSHSRVYNIEFGLWETAELVDDAYKVAEQQIYQEALNLGIAKESRENAIKILTSILRGLGFTKIHIGFKSTQESLENKNMKF